MTAAEQIYHGSSFKSNAPGGASSTDASSINGGSSVRLNISEVAAQFNLEYYNTMSRQPEHLHGFYGKQSQLIHSLEGDLDSPICTTLETIHARIMNMGYQGARIVVESIDAQASLNGGIFILTAGNMKLKNGTQKKFVQSFFLAEQANGYYVLNDSFRFIESIPVPVSKDNKTEAAVSKPVEARSEAIKPTESVKAKEVEATTQPQIKAPVPAQPEKLKIVEKAPAAPEKAVSKPQPPKKAETPANPPSTGSWASLAAGGSNLWQDGVVAPTKSPVVTMAGPTVAKGANISSSRNENAKSQSSRQPSQPSDKDRSEKRPMRQDREPRPSRPDARVSQDITRSVFVRNLADGTDSAALRKALETFGEITSIEMNLSRGQAFVEFQSSEKAGKVIGTKLQLNGTEISVEARRQPGSRLPRRN